MDIVIIDIDGTLTEVSQFRLSFITGETKDWHSFHSLCLTDTINQRMTRLLREMDPNRYRKIVLTGRNEAHRCVTEAQVDTCDIDHEEILMRPDNDWRPDHQVKFDVLREYGIRPEDVSYVFEDRTSMVEAWREVAPNALVMQVAKGDF